MSAGHHAAAPETRAAPVSQPLLAGVVAAIVGFASSFTIILTGLRSVGATPEQASSGLLVLSVAMGATAMALSWRTRLPVAIAWSTPGAALLVSAGVQPGGWPAAVGAFMVCGVLLALAGLWRGLGRWIARIPAPLANALLAGVLLPLCLAPVRAVTELPALAGPVVLVWALLLCVARRWAVPGALAAAIVAVLVDGPAGTDGARLLPALAFTAPELHAGAIAGLALPLFVVTMASQNVSGMSVLAAFGYRPDLRPVLLTTGAATAVIGPFGGHAINLAAITAALVAGPEAGPDPRRRWIAAVSGGASHLLLGLGAGLATALLAASPPLLVAAIAGLALLGALAGALSAAAAEGEHRDAAVVTLVVSAAGFTVLGVSAPFWGLLAGLALLGLQRLTARAPAAA
jgi:benzoate membrane transport protein